MRYILFGTGDYYRRFSHWFADREVLAVLDNDEKKQGTEMDGRPVIAPSDIISLDFDAVVILSFYVTEMKKQLADLGVSEDKIFHFYDLHELFQRDDDISFGDAINNNVIIRDISQNIGKIHDQHFADKRVLLLSHDLTNGGPALALYHAAVSLEKAGYGVVFASMLDGELRSRLEDDSIPVVVDERLQICTMSELSWTRDFDLIICNTINYHIFLSDRDESIPVIWWLHDSPFFYEGIKSGRLESISMANLKVLSVGPVPRGAMMKYRPDIVIDDLIYGVSGGV